MEKRLRASDLGASFERSTRNQLQGMPNDCSVILDYEKFNFSMMREYFSWVGLFTFTKQGNDLLNQHFIFDNLKSLIKTNGKRDHVLTIVLHSLNYKKNDRHD